MALREENSSNIAINGLEETKKVNTEKWREEEIKKVMNLVDQMGVPFDGEIAIRYRGGKKREEGAKPRPLIVSGGRRNKSENISECAQAFAERVDQTRLHLSGPHLATERG